MEIFIVVARFSLDDAPVFAGSCEECRAYISDMLDRAADNPDTVWNALRKQAGDLYGSDVTTKCICLVLMHVLPLPIEEVERFDAEVQD